MKTFLTLFVLLFSSSVFAGVYPYNGKTALLKSQSTNAGDLHEWLRLCGCSASKNAKETEKQVKRLSTPDYKAYSKAKALERAKKTKLKIIKNLKAITKIKNRNKELKKFFKDYSKIFGDLHW